MDDNNFENKILDDSSEELSLESILAEFKAEEDLEGKLQSQHKEPSRSIVFESPVQNVGEAKISSAIDFIESIADEESTQSSPIFSDVSAVENNSREANFDPYEDTREIKPKKARRETQSDAVTSDVSEQTRSLTDESIWELATSVNEKREDYAPKGDYTPAADTPEAPDVKEKLYAPLVGLLAANAAKREARRRCAKEQAEQHAKNATPELKPEKASALYAAQAQSLRLRCLFAAALCIILVYLSFDFPAFGALGSSVKIRTLMCLVLELVVMLVGLDIITNGFVSLFKGKPGSESLIAVSCLVSALDAVMIAVTGNTSIGLPFCAVSALSVAFAMLGSYLSCASFAVNFKVASIPQNPSVVLSQQCSGDDAGRVLAKAKRPVTGFVRESEEADIFEKVYRLLAPILLIAALVLTLFCYFASEKCTELIHTLSTCTSVAASFSAILGFSFPFSVLTRRLARSGVAIAGYSGCSELGRIKRVVITDTDLFPKRTVGIANVAIAEGSYPDKVISYTGSMLAAAGLGIAPIFTELMKKNNCTMQKVEDFACHEGGGIVARISGDQVYVGCVSFMRLMGIHIVKGSVSNNAVCTAINDSYSGSFEINYTPVTSVQRALVSLLSGKTEPVFAVRDFNITPMLVKQKFRLPAVEYDFPSFADRYAVSSPDAQESGAVAGMFSRGGLNSVAGLMHRGRRLYIGVNICAALSVLGTVLGMVLMLALCWTGAYDSASCGNIMIFMLLWLVPELVISLWLRN